MPALPSPGKQYFCPRCGGAVEEKPDAVMFRFRCRDCHYGTSNVAVLITTTQPQNKEN